MMGSQHVLYIGCEFACLGMVSVFRGIFKGKKSLIQHNNTKKVFVSINMIVKYLPFLPHHIHTQHVYRVFAT